MYVLADRRVLCYTEKNGLFLSVKSNLRVRLIWFLRCAHFRSPKKNELCLTFAICKKKMKEVFILSHATCPPPPIPCVYSC